jgi:hypothetical protein
MTTKVFKYKLDKNTQVQTIQLPRHCAIISCKLDGDQLVVYGLHAAIDANDLLPVKFVVCGTGVAYVEDTNNEILTFIGTVEWTDTHKHVRHIFRATPITTILGR